MTESNTPKKSPVGLVLGLVALVALAGIAGLSVTQYLGQAEVAQNRSTGKAAIGGPFNLVDHNGQPVDETVLSGKPSLIYFGYTYCPDVCPDSLVVMSDALDILGPETASKVRPVFISVDPERDTVPVVKDYVAHFYPGMLGLTGSMEQVKAVASAYRVYYKKAEEDEADPTAYLVDHSSITYLMDGDGGYMAHFSHGTRADAMAERLKALLNP